MDGNILIFLIVKPCLLPILIPFWPKYSPQDDCFINNTYSFFLYNNNNNNNNNNNSRVQDPIVRSGLNREDF